MKFSENEIFLKAFHAQYPGCTSSTMADGVAENDQSSYDLLAAVIPKIETALHVLDIACGDGYLLGKLESRKQPGLELFGIDMSEDELAAAKKRLSSTTQLVQGKVQQLPFPDASMDFVTCHMALMLMDSLEEVLKEIARVLKPRGVFSAIFSGPSEPTPSSEVYRERLRATLSKKDLNFLYQIGDSRLRTEKDCLALLSTYFSIPAMFKPLSLKHYGTIDQATEYFMTFYGSGFLDVAGKLTLERDLKEAFANLIDSRGLVKYTAGIIHLTATKK